MGLLEYEGVPTRSLSYGHRKLVELARAAVAQPRLLLLDEPTAGLNDRALMSKPALLLLDEPSLGLAPLVVKQIFDVIDSLRAAGTPILLVEQNAQKALEIADCGIVLRQGRVTTLDAKRSPTAQSCGRRTWA